MIIRDGIELPSLAEERVCHQWLWMIAWRICSSISIFSQNNNFSHLSFVWCEKLSPTYLFLLGPTHVNKWGHIGASQNNGLINYIFPINWGFYMELSLILLKRKQNKENHVMQCYLLHGFLSPVIIFHFLYLSHSQTFDLSLVTLIDANPYRFSWSLSIFNIFNFMPSSKLQLLKSMRPTKPSFYTWVDIPVDLCGNEFLLPLIFTHIYTKWRV